MSMHQIIVDSVNFTNNNEILFILPVLSFGVGHINLNQ